MKKGQVVEKILSSGQIFPEDLEPHCDLGLEDSNLKLSNNTLVCHDAPLCQIWLQKVQKFRRYGRKLIFEDLTPQSVLELVEDRNPTFLHDTPDYDDAP